MPQFWLVSDFVSSDVVSLQLDASMRVDCLKPRQNQHLENYHFCPPYFHWQPRALKALGAAPDL
jgi:hypothetical protein